MISVLRKNSPCKLIVQQQRYLWQYVCQAFNLVDQHRLKIVGPDRLCAEWVLKNSGAVRFLNNRHILHSDYNTLPPESMKVQVAEIDGTKSTIMSIGLDHLIGCNYITKLTLDNCKYLDDEAFYKLQHVQKTLEEVTIDQCRNISRVGLLDLAKSVPNLKRLTIGKDMPLNKDLEALIPELKTHLQQCEITVK